MSEAQGEVDALINHIVPVGYVKNDDTPMIYNVDAMRAATKREEHEFGFRLGPVSTWTMESLKAFVAHTLYLRSRFLIVDAVEDRYGEAEEGA